MNNKPGNVKRAPIDPHHSAMKNLRTSFDAGPLKKKIKLIVTEEN
jgi:hypothetical protein